jgi:hypothetical protein
LDPAAAGEGSTPGNGDGGADVVDVVGDGGRVQDAATSASAQINEARERINRHSARKPRRRRDIRLSACLGSCPLPKRRRRLFAHRFILRAGGPRRLGLPAATII